MLSLFLASFDRAVRVDSGFWQSFSVGLRLFSGLGISWV